MRPTATAILFNSAPCTFCFRGARISSAICGPKRGDKQGFPKRNQRPAKKSRLCPRYHTERYSFVRLQLRNVQGTLSRRERCLGVRYTI